MIIEACVENFLEATNAQSFGASRIELCDNLGVGGTTPSYGLIKYCIENLNIPSFVMIRPHGNNFTYNDDEINIMLEDILICKNLKADGVVFGCLSIDNTINYPQMQKLCTAAKGMNIIMHKAYDEITNPWLEIEKLSKLGINYILSSGAEKSIFDGKKHLAKTFEICQKYGIKLTAAGGLTAENLNHAKQEISCHDFHGRLIVGKL